MGIFDKLLSKSGGGGDDDFYNCPYCKGELQGWGCISCGVEFVLEDDKLVERLLALPDPECMSPIRQ